MESIVEKYESVEFEVSGKIEYHNLSSIYPMLPELDPDRNKLEVALVDEDVIWLKVTEYDRFTKCKIDGERLEYEKILGIINKGDYKVHLFANGNINLEEL